MYIDIKVKLSLSKFLKNDRKKALLIRIDPSAQDSEELIHLIKNEEPSHLVIDQHQSQDENDILSILSGEKPTVLIFTNIDFENIYVKYHLERLDVKIIIICNSLLLHPTLDPSIYFAPIEGKRVQRHLLEVINLPILLTSAKETKNLSINDILTPVVEEKAAPESNIRAHFINQKLMTTDSSMMQLLADRVLHSSDFKQFLFKIIYLSRNVKSISIAAANAITILNYARVSLSNLDLSNTQFPFADLTYAMMSHANLSRANLNNVIFKHAYLSDANLTDSDMTNSDFGELPFIKGSRIVSRLSYSPDGKFIAAICAGSVMIWDLASKELYAAFEGQPLGIQAFAFSRDSQFLASIGFGDDIRVWDIENKKLARSPLMGHSGFVNSIAFSPDGKILASGGNPICLWDWRTGYLLREPIMLTDNIGINISSILFNYDSSLLICARGKEIIIWDLKRNGLIKTSLKGHLENITSLDLRQDGKLLISAGGKDKTIRVWDMSGYEQIGEPLKGHTAEVSAVAFSTGNTVLSGSHDGTVRVWDIQTGEQKGNPIMYHARKVECIAISHDGKYLATSDQNGSIRQLKLDQSVSSIKLLASNHTSAVKHIAINSSNTLLISASDKTILVGNLLNPHSHALVSFPNKEIIQSVSFTSEDEVIVGGVYEKTFFIWKMKAGRLNEPHVITLSNVISCIAFNATSKIFAIGSEDKTVQFWCVNSKKFLDSMQLLLDSAVSSLSFSNDGTFLTIQSRQKRYLWRSKKREGVEAYESIDTFERYSSVIFSPSNRYYALINGNQVELLEGEQRKPVGKQLAGHTNAIISAAFNHDSTLFATGCEGGTIRIWSVALQQCVRFYRGFQSIGFIHFSSDGNYIAFGSGNEVGLFRLRSMVTDFCDYVLLWCTGPTSLTANRTDLTGIKGLAVENKELLTVLGQDLRDSTKEDKASETKKAPLANPLTDMSRYPLAAVYASMSKEQIYNMGVRLAAESNYPVALAYFDYLVKNYPPQAHVLNEIGEIYLRLKLYPLALPTLQLALQLDPSSCDIMTNLGTLYVGMSAYQDALKMFDKVLSTKPAFSSALSGKATALLFLGRYKESIDFFGRTLKITPSYQHAKNLRALAHVFLGEYDEASIQYEIMLIQQEAVNPVCNRGLVQFHLDHFTEALEWFNKGLRIDAKDAKSLSYKGLTLLCQNQVYQAISCFNQVLALNENTEFVKFAKSLVQGGFAVIACLKKDSTSENESLMIASKQSCPLRYQEVLLALGITYRVLEEYDRAFTCFKTLLTHFPDCISAWIQVGITSVKQGDFKKAITFFEKALTFNLDNKTVLRYLEAAKASLMNSNEHANYLTMRK